jgi:hypothetical protein
MNPQTEKENHWREVAKSLMKEIMYDNGFVDRNHPEEYPEEHVVAIEAQAEIFFGAHPEFFVEWHMHDMCCGEWHENQEKYAIYPEYEGLAKALNEYHDG